MSQIKSQDILLYVEDLPDLVKRKIFLFYAQKFCNLSRENWPKQIYKDYDYICYFFDKIDSKGYIKFHKSYLGLLLLKFPNMSFNFDELEFLQQYVTKCSDLVEMFRSYFSTSHQNLGPAITYIPRMSNILVAGGYFTRYTENVFTKQFPQFFEYFKKVKDIDIFYYDPSALEEEYDNSIYLKLCQCVDCQRTFNLVGTRNKDTIKTIEAFDWDCCKIFYSFNQDNVYLHHTLLLPNFKNKRPTFFEFNLPIQVEFPLNKSDSNKCVCKLFKRTLKYFMKGFYDKSNEKEELNQARYVLEDLIKPYFPSNRLGKCKFCYNFLDSCLNNTVYSQANLQI